MKNKYWQIHCFVPQEAISSVNNIHLHHPAHGPRQILDSRVERLNGFVLLSQYRLPNIESKDLKNNVKLGQGQHRLIIEYSLWNLG